jgi:hypothetical protein
MENNMDKKIEKLQSLSEAMLIHALDERLSKSYNVTQGTHEKGESTQVEQTSINKHILKRFDSNIGVNHALVAKGIHFPKNELRKFDGTNVFTWVNKIEECF